VGDSPRHLTMGASTHLLQYALYLLWDRSGRISFVKAKAHADDANNNLADFLANQGRLQGCVMDLSQLVPPTNWVDTALVLAHQPLDFLTKLVVRHSVTAPTSMLRFTCFADRSVGRHHGPTFQCRAGPRAVRIQCLEACHPNPTQRNAMARD